jgi:hypothetical protein
MNTFNTLIHHLEFSKVAQALYVHKMNGLSLFIRRSRATSILGHR